MPNQVGVNAHSKDWSAVTELLVTGMLSVCDCDMSVNKERRAFWWVAQVRQPVNQRSQSITRQPILMSGRSRQ